ncbi:MAG: tannase/feruloyl esterase family alpha/beta hydrolase [Pseudomonadota bacterium]
MKLGSKQKKHVHVLSSLLAIFALPATAFGATCEDLGKLALPDTTVTLAETVAAGALPGTDREPALYANLPAFCRVQATVAPTSDSDIKIEVWLPTSGWNGKFQGVGNGGWTGSIATAALADGLRRGYATASTDTGHEGGSASFALGHPEKLVDFGYRAVHEMTVKGKELTSAFYGNDAEHAYFVGCSAGGRQAMVSVQKYPADYDGVVAGSPGLNWSGRALLTVHVGQAVAKTPESAIPREKFAVLNTAAISACDSIDGVVDGVIEDPAECLFDPQVVQCKAGDAADCLTPAQVETAKVLYSPVKHTATGEELVAGFSAGSELGWNTMAGAQPFGPGVDLFKFVVFNNPDWDFKTLNWNSDIDKTRAASTDLDAMDTNLQPYFSRGGKIISYHGWADPQISPGSTFAYYEDVLEAMGEKPVLDNYRLFMVPGMNHCGGGVGTDQFDMLTALENWVENDQVPETIAAAKIVEGKTVRTRLLCPVPQVATYKGDGSTDDAANFMCK